MTIFKRFGYFLGGLTVGIILLMFFLGGKKASCAYGPTARVLKNIRIKSPTITPEARRAMQSYSLDTSVVANYLKDGDVIFKESNIVINDSCKKYVIRGKSNDQRYLMQVSNCDSTAVITGFKKYVNH